MGLDRNEGRDAFRDLHAEAGLLGAILMDNALIAVAAHALTGEHFARSAHGEIFDAMVALSNRKRSIDPVTLLDVLAGRVDAVGGPGYIMGLVDAVPRRKGVDAYVSIIRDRAIRRDLRSAILKSKADIEDQALPLDDAIASMVSLIYRQAPKDAMSYASEYGPEFRAWIDDDSARRHTRVHTGIASLDLIHKGGMPIGVTVLGGRTSHGKSSLGLTIAKNVGMGDRPRGVQYVSGEMDRRQMTGRLVALEGRLDAEAIINGDLEYVDRSSLRQAVDTVTKTSKITFIDSKLTPSQIRASAMRQAMDDDGLALLVIDYVGIMKADQKMIKMGITKAGVIGEMMKAYKEIADELQIPVLLLAQLSRGTTAKKKPTLEDLKDSGNIEEDAHCVWLLHRPPGTSDGDVYVAKNRNGKVGDAKLYFDQTCMRYASCDDSMASMARSIVDEEEEL